MPFSVSIIGFLLVIFIIATVGYIELRSINTTSMSDDKVKKINNSKAIFISISIFSGIALVFQGYLLFSGTSKEAANDRDNKYQGVEKCNSSKCEEL